MSTLIWGLVFTIVVGVLAYAVGWVKGWAKGYDAIAVAAEHTAALLHQRDLARKEAGKLSRIIGYQRRAIKALKATQPAKAARQAVPAQPDVH